LTADFLRCFEQQILCFFHRQRLLNALRINHLGSRHNKYSLSPLRLHVVG
jgi:hypothetical protein